jgi:CubicO group peptidase (beta-lactamase class C family)
MKNDLQRVLDGLDVQIPEMMQQWGVAGLSVAIVKDGKVVLTKGYGFRDVQEKLPVTENTVMPIGSTTKSFTSLILSMLEEEGKLDWDKPVKEYIPWLKLSDPIVTEQVTARDLLCHRTGLPKFDVHGVFCTKDDRKEMVEDLQYLSMSAPFRTQLQYSNQMVMLGG